MRVLNRRVGVVERLVNKASYDGYNGRIYGEVLLMFCHPGFVFEIVRLGLMELVRSSRVLEKLGGVMYGIWVSELSRNTLSEL